MKIKKIVFVTICLLKLTAFQVGAQSILVDYFNGNQDSLKAEALKLINSPEPTFKAALTPEMDAQSIANMGFEQIYPSENHFFTARDGKKIFTHKFFATSDHTVILLHGVLSTAYLYNKTAGLLREATQAEVYAVDVRGHGQSEGNVEDVDYINQYTDDLADIVMAVRKEKPKGKIFLAGHSMGGGIILRYMMSEYQDLIDGVLLFAPLIGHNSPAFQESKGEASDSSEVFVKVHVERIIGLKMLNEIENHEFDDKPVLFFNLPQNMPLTKYSHRANVSMAPEDYADGLQAVKVPMIVVIGSNDEAFSATALQKAILNHSDAEFHLINDCSHNGIRHHHDSFEKIKNWYSQLK